MKRIHQITFALVALFALSAAPANLWAATITVTSTADSGAGSLRAALASAADGDTIDATGVSGTILLTSGGLFVSSSVSIVGPGATNLAVDGNHSNRVFDIDGPFNTGTVNISNLTIANGSAGGGIYNYHATLIISNCTLSGNSGSAILNDGFSGSASLRIINSTVSGNSAASGAGIYNGGNFGNASLEILNSIVRDNSTSGAGAGIYTDGEFGGTATVQIVSSTLAGNSAGGSGGAIFNAGTYAGTHPDGISTVQIINSTLSENNANLGGAIANYFAGNLRIVNSTLSDNSDVLGAGGIYNGGIVEIGSTILKGGASGVNISNSGTITSLGYNLSSDNGGGFLTALGDQTNTDPLLGSLQDNGGPTKTMALRAGSPAIDKGKSFGVTTDQRGQPRPYDNPNVSNASGGDGADIGAYEASELRMVNVQKVGNHLRLDFTSWLGTNYEVQSGSDLNTGSWGSLAGITPGNGGIASTTVSNAFSQTQQFYRIHPVP